MSGNYSLYDFVNAMVDGGLLARLKYPSTCRVLLVLMRRADSDGFTFIGRDRLCREAGVARNTLAQAIDDLQQVGLIEVTKKGQRHGYRLVDLGQTGLETRRGESGTGLETRRGESGTGLETRRVKTDKPAQSRTQTGLVSDTNRPSFCAHKESSKESLKESNMSSSENDSALTNGQPRRSRSRSTPKPSGFSTWYATYPRKRDPRIAEHAYPKAVERLAKARGLDTASAEAELLAATERYAASAAGTEARYIKYPASWLNADAWDNEREATCSLDGEESKIELSREATVQLAELFGHPQEETERLLNEHDKHPR